MENVTSSIAHFDPPLLAEPYASTEADAECYYVGTDFLEVKIVLIGIFAALLAVTSFFFNAFFTCVFVLNKQLRRSPLYYFGVLAALDTIMAINYLALMAVPVYMDHFGWLWLYLIFLMYLKPMLTLSNCAIFASVLMILLATVERLLLTSQLEKLSTLRRFLSRRRPQVCLCLILLALSYKMCTYFEIDYIENENCEDWTRYEVIPTELSRNATYNFWWMFVTRNLVDRIIPFFALVFTNILIIRTLKREHLRSRNDTSSIRKKVPIQSYETEEQQQQESKPGLGLSKSTSQKSVRYADTYHRQHKAAKSDIEGLRRKREGVTQSVESLSQSIRRKSRNAGSRVRRVLSRRSSSMQEDSVNKKNLRDATRALLAVVTMYLMSQTLQVLITFWEAFWKVTLENEYKHFYSFINDIMSILPLLSSALRFPVYCAISKPIATASSETLCKLFSRTNLSGSSSLQTKSVTVRPIITLKNTISLINENNLSHNCNGGIHDNHRSNDNNNNSDGLSREPITGHIDDSTKPDLEAQVFRFGNEIVAQATIRAIANPRRHSATVITL